jgi:hypothetical protein
MNAPIHTAAAVKSLAARLAPRGVNVLYPNLYAWYILAATLDIVVTHTILHHLGGSEVNRIADALIQKFGVLGMVGLKYSSILLVVTICEIVGRRSVRLGRRLAVAAIAISVFPVGVGLLKVWQWNHLPAQAIEIAELVEEDEAEVAPVLFRSAPPRAAPVAQHGWATDDLDRLVSW